MRASENERGENKGRNKMEQDRGTENRWIERQRQREREREIER